MKNRVVIIPAVCSLFYLLVNSCTQEPIPHGGTIRKPIVPTVSAWEHQTKSHSDAEAEEKCIASYTIEGFGVV